MYIVKNPKFEWLRYKWFFILASSVLVLAGSVSLFVRGLNLGVDFTGGTLVYVKFTDPPQLERIRDVLREGGLSAQEVTRFDEPSKNQVQIRMARIESDELEDLTDQSQRVLATLHREFDPEQTVLGTFNLNEISRNGLGEWLEQRNPEGLENPDAAAQHYDEMAARIVDFRRSRGGTFSGFSELDPLELPDPIRTGLEEEATLGKVDFNNVSRAVLAQKLQEFDPQGLSQELSMAELDQRYAALAGQIINFRSSQGGVLVTASELDRINIPEAVKNALAEHFYFGSFNLISVESVGPKVGRELQGRARQAVLLSLLGMLAYIAFRFRPIYGLAAIVALFHDVFITVGFFSISNKEISLTVIAALLTLVGYSINDTIVVFDRVRENLKLMRRDDLSAIINTSINQTLNRTILTSGMTFLAVFALYLLGGQVLNGFSFALVVGIIIGTYSSIAIASPIVLWWQNFIESRRART